MGTRIIEVDNGTWIFEEDGVRFFLLTGENKALLIDSGMMTVNAKEMAESLTDLPVELINTHADPDHINCNEQFEFAYMHPSETANYYNTQKRKGEIKPIWDGDVIDLGERRLEIIHLPGHTPGSIAVLDVKNRRLFSGDPIQDGKIFMFGPQREMNSYLIGLKRLSVFADRFDDIYPSHGTYPVSKDMIDKLYEAAERIIKGEITGKEANVFGMPVISYDVGIATFLCDK